MGKSLSLDIRERVVALVNEGLSCREAARRLRISAANVVRIMQHKRRTGLVKAGPQGPHLRHAVPIRRTNLRTPSTRRVPIATQLAPGTVVILDNLSTHKSPRAAEALRRHGCWFLFLPPYSPDLNPIEMAFSKLKAHLRRIDARTFDTLFEALGDICDLFDPQERWNFIKAAGYASD